MGRRSDPAARSVVRAPTLEGQAEARCEGRITNVPQNGRAARHALATTHTGGKRLCPQRRDKYSTTPSYARRACVVTQSRPGGSGMGEEVALWQ